MKNLIIIISILFFGITAWSQPPSWTVDPAAYTNQMFVNATITRHCETVGDFLAVFDENNVIRGVSEIGIGDNAFFIAARSEAVNNEVLHFKYYDSEADIIHSLNDQTITFTNNFLLGLPDPIIVDAPESESPQAFCNDLTLYLDEQGEAMISVLDVDNESTDDCAIQSVSIDMQEFNCAHLGENTVQLMVVDASNNTDTCMARVTVRDTIKPVVNCLPLTIYLDANGAAEIQVADVNNESFDNCDIVQLSLDRTSFDCTHLGRQNVILTAIDQSGNSDFCTTEITVLDTILPTPNCLSDTIYLDINGMAEINLSVVDDSSLDNCSILTRTLSKTNFTCADVGHNWVIMELVDEAGNVNACISTITVMDTMITRPVCVNQTVYLDQDGLGSIDPVNVSLGSQDNCGISNLMLSKDDFSCTDLGVQNVTLSITDDNGNISSCIAEVTTVDTIAPMVLCRDAIVYLDTNGQAEITVADVNNGSFDNCDIVHLSLDGTSFNCAQLGQQEVVLTAIDQSGNTNFCRATVTVLDTILPSPDCLNDTIYLDINGMAEIDLSIVDNNSYDNCSILSRTLSKTEFTCADVGANSVTLELIDAAGNVNSCFSTITVLDTIKARPICINQTVYLDQDGLGSINPNDVSLGSEDNCGISDLSLSKVDFSCMDLGVQEVILTITDEYNNISSCIAQVTVLDTISPFAICKNIELFLDENGTASIAPSDIDAGSVDNCRVDSMSIDKVDFTCITVGFNEVIMTIFDQSGNQSSCTSTVNVIDTIPPTVFCDVDTIYLDADGMANLTPQDIDNGSFDNCNKISLRLNKSSFSCDEVGVNEVVLEAVDRAGNISSCATSVLVLDTIAPTMVCQDVILYLNENGNGEISADDVNNNSFDNCEIQSIELSQTNFNCEDIGEQMVTMIVTDNLSNVSECNIVLTVVDTFVPLITCQDYFTFVDHNGLAIITLQDVLISFSDNCKTDTVFLDKTVFDIRDSSIQEIMITAIDENGLINTCMSTLTLEYPEENTRTMCSDGLDNDGDGLVDCADPDCPKPNVVSIDIVNPSSTDCEISDSNGSLSIQFENADLFSIDNGLSFQTTPTFSGLANGSYEIIVMDSITGCIASFETQVHNTFGIDVITSDQFLSCGTSEGIPLSATVIDYSGDYRQRWNHKDEFVLNPNDLYQEGVYVVHVRNAHGCTDTDTLQILREGLTDHELGPNFVRGPNVICPGIESVLFNAEVKDLVGTVQWSYSGDNVILSPSGNTLTCQLIFLEGATPGDLRGEFTNECGTKTAVLPVNFGDSEMCAIYSNCQTDLEVSTSDFDNPQTPSHLNVSHSLQATGTIKERDFVFKAGYSVLFKEVFEVNSGVELSVEIGPCNE